MPTTIPTIISSTRPGSPSAGDAYFETDTKRYIIYDGANWRAYQNDGAYYNYSSGNTHSGEFDGNDYAVGTVGVLNGVSAFSTSLWFRYQGTIGATHIPISGGSSTSNRWYLWLKNATTFQYGITNNFPEWTASSMSNGQWYHVALVHDGTSATVYLDGFSLGTNTGLPSANQSWIGTNFNIGRYGAGAGYYWNGWIDEVSVFNKALTSTEVTNIYSNKLYLSPTALWRLNDDTTDELGAYDLTNNTITFDGTNKAY